MKQFKEFWWESFKENLALVCLTKDQNGVTHVAGMNCTLLGYKGDDDIVKVSNKSFPMEIRNNYIILEQIR